MLLNMQEKSENQVLGILLYNILEPQSDLNQKAKSALQKIILNYRDLKVLEPFMNQTTPPDILCNVLFRTI